MRRLFHILVAWASLGCGRGLATSVTFRVQDTAGHPVADAVISLVPLDAPPTSAPVSNGATAEIEQSRTQFHPFVTVVRVGTTVQFPNRDKVRHHVYSLSDPKRFELPLYDPGKSGTVVFDHPGIVAVGCNIHDWMLAYVDVVPTPWFAKTALDGGATIAEVPPGRYRADIWQWRAKENPTREITVPDSSTVDEAFTLSLGPDRRIRHEPLPGNRGYD